MDVIDHKEGCGLKFNPLS